MSLLSVSNLSIAFTQYTRGLRQIELPVIHDLSITVQQGEVVAIIGASGSGKSLLAHSILGLLPSNASMTGDMTFQGEPLTQTRKEALRGKEIALVPQGVTNLDPLMRVGAQVKDSSALSRYGLDASVEKLYPFELSGGMARRVLIATATAASPRLVIADEPTPGLHIDAARRVLSHFREMADEGAGVLLITHDLQLALEVADRVSVFYAGTAIEDALAADFQSPETLRHPYTRALWRAMPEHGFHSRRGSQPLLKKAPAGCPFAASCELWTDACSGIIPWHAVRGGHVRCMLAQEGCGLHGT